MAEGWGRLQWAQTAALLAMLANCNRDPKKTRPYKPSDFDPYYEQTGTEKIRIDGQNIELMKDAFNGF